MPDININPEERHNQVLNGSSAAETGSTAGVNRLRLPGWQAYHPQAFQNRLWICILLTLPVLIFSPNLQSFFHLQPPAIPGIHYMPFILGMLIYIYGGMVFIEGAYREIRRFQPGMMTLASLAITLTMSYSVAVTFGVNGEEIYWEMCLLTVLMLLGHWLVSRSLLSTSRSLNNRLSLLPEKACLVENGDEQEIMAACLIPGNEVKVSPGERFPADGLALTGYSSADESCIPGMPAYVPKFAGDTVLAGTVNLESEILVQVTKTWNNSFLARSAQLVFEAQNYAHPKQSRAELIAYWLAVLSVIAASLTSLYWAIKGEDLLFIIERVAAVLVIVSPSSLLLSYPLVTGSAVLSLLDNGIVLLKHAHFERAGRTTYAILGKTGVVTSGRMKMQRFYNLSNLEEHLLLSWAAAVEASSRHPAAEAIIEAARLEELTAGISTDFIEQTGVGTVGIVDGHHISLGGSVMMEKHFSLLSSERRDAEREASLAGLSIIYMLVDDELQAIMALSDQPSEQSAYALNMIHALGIRTAIVSGDSEAVTQRTAAHLDIINYASGVSPGGKIRQIKEIKQREPAVAVIENVLQDGVALREADISVALGAAYDLDSLEAGLLLLKNQLRDVPRLVSMSRKYYWKIRENIILALLYNVIAIPIAAGLISPAGWIIPLPLAAIAMFSSILLVDLNARLLRFK